MVAIETIAGTVVTAGLGAIFGWNGWKARQSQRGALSEATEVTAVITTAEVSSSRDHDESIGEAGVDYDYVPKLTFEYTFEGEEYESSNKYPPVDNVNRGGYEGKRGAEKWLDGYESGQQVTAYVNPEEPGEAFLEAETNTLRNTAMIVVGAVLFGGSLLGIVATFALGL